MWQDSARPIILVRRLAPDIFFWLLLMRWLKRWRLRILLFMAVVGPGFITANVDNDTGGIFTYSAAGAQFGYSLLWIMIPVTLALIVVQEMSARMGAVTGKGLSDLIREEFGFRVTFLLMLGLVVVNFANVVSEFAGVASSLELFNVPRYFSVPGAAIIVWLIVVKGSYKSVEKVFLAASLFYICYIVAGVLAGPEWTRALVSTIKPPSRAELTNNVYLYATIGVVGTTIAPWMQFYLQSSIVEKGVTQRQYGASRIDVITGCFFTDIVAWFIVIACAATLFVHGHRDIRDAADAAYALRPLAGDYAYILFAAGLFNASLFSASILPISTAYTVCEGLGFESGVGKRFKEAPVFYWLYTVLIVLGAGLVLLPKLPLVKVIIFSQVLNGVLLPFIVIFMLLLINKPDLMGKRVNSRFYNVVAWGTTVVLIALTMAMLVTTLRASGGGSGAGSARRIPVTSHANVTSGT
jgi:Mn2+/Fe2+ NRAMP family transporter